MNFGEILGVVLTPLGIIAILVWGTYRRRRHDEEPQTLLGVVKPPETLG